MNIQSDEYEDEVEFAEYYKDKQPKKYSEIKKIKRPAFNEREKKRPNYKDRPAPELPPCDGCGSDNLKM